MSDRYAVMGFPVAHSKSPYIHAMFAAQTGQDLTYTAIEVRPGEFAQAVHEFQRAGGRGLNVTLPFKEEAFALAQSHSDRAARAEAANTLWFESDGRICADNTDGAGLVRDLEINHAVVLRDRRVLLLGAGGAARGVLGPLLDAGPASLFVANRTGARASALAERFTHEGPVRGGGFDALAEASFDLIVNATAASLLGEVPPLPDSVLAPGGVCYDMMYGARPTAFVRWGETCGAALSVDGLGMLVEQAAESFLRWRQVRPATAEVIAALRAGGA